MNQHTKTQLEKNVIQLSTYSFLNKDISLQDILNDINFDFIENELSNIECEIIEDSGWEIIDLLEEKERFKEVKYIIDRFIKEDFDLSNWKITEIPYPNTYVLFPIKDLKYNNKNTHLDILVQDTFTKIYYTDDYQDSPYNMFEAYTLNEAIDKFNMMMID